VDLLTDRGIPLERIYLDPCVMPVGTGGEHGVGAAECITRIMSRYPGIHTTAGLSNVSFGLPMRRLLNQTYLAALMSRGLDSVIVDPTDRQLLATLYATEALLGRDEYCAGYLRAFRKGLLEPNVPSPRPGATSESPAATPSAIMSS